MHTSTLVCYRGRRVMIDCGESWRGRMARVGPHAIALTHAHPDHAFGLADGAPCPVFATRETWQRIGDFPIPAGKRRRIRARHVQRIEGIDFEAFPVLHSVRAPAVGYRIRAGRVAVFYVPDVVWIPERQAALRDVRLYVGDGATITRSMVRKHPQSGELFGHATVRQQIGWCAREGVAEMIVTHCGSDIVAADERKVAARLRSLSDDRRVAVAIAHDGMERILR